MAPCWQPSVSDVDASPVPHLKPDSHTLREVQRETVNRWQLIRCRPFCWSSPDSDRPATLLPEPHWYGVR
jgi:hypothetical protein